MLLSQKDYFLHIKTIDAQCGLPRNSINFRYLTQISIDVHSIRRQNPPKSVYKTKQKKKIKKNTVESTCTNGKCVNPLPPCPL